MLLCSVCECGRPLLWPAFIFIPIHTNTSYSITPTTPFTVYIFTRHRFCCHRSCNYYHLCCRRGRLSELKCLAGCWYDGHPLIQQYLRRWGGSSNSSSSGSNMVVLDLPTITALTNNLPPSKLHTAKRSTVATTTKLRTTIPQRP